MLVFVYTDVVAPWTAPPSSEQSPNYTDTKWKDAWFHLANPVAKKGKENILGGKKKPEMLRNCIQKATVKLKKKK